MRNFFEGFPSQHFIFDVSFFPKVKTITKNLWKIRNFSIIIGKNKVKIVHIKN